MSKYLTIAVEYKTFECLKKALADLKISAEINENFRENTIHLVGYHGDTRQQTASVVIRRKDVNRFSGGMSNDIGFAWNEEKGLFDALVSQYDSTASKDLMRQLKQRYAFQETVAKAKDKGYNITEQKETNGEIRLVLVRR